MNQRIGEIFNFGALHLEWTTALYIFVVFIVTMTLMNLLLFRPLVRTLEGRESLLDSGSAEIEAAEKELETAIAAFAKKQMSTLEEIGKMIQTAQESAKAEATKVTDAAAAKAQETLKSASTELTADREEALAQAGPLSQELSKLIQNKVLN